MRYVFAILAVTWLATAAEPEYRSVWEGDDGHLHILRSDGKEERVRKLKYQTSFGNPGISWDRRTVAWLEISPNPTRPNTDDLPFTLVLYRSGRILHRFEGGSIFWDWQFWSDSQVAYSTGPTHGGATQCVLRDVDSGKIVATWDPKSNTDPPDWAEKLRY
jgi:hypothetical protein